jgi:hypothetical protein
MREALEQWSNRVRERTEVCIAPYVSGHFMKRRRLRGPRLPVIDVYLVRGTSADVDTIIAEWQTHRPIWLDAIGVDFSQWDSYSDQSMIFTPSDIVDRPRHNHQLVVFGDALNKNSGHEQAMSQPSMRIHFEYSLNELTLPLALIELLWSVERNIEDLRLSVFRTARPNWLSVLLLHPFFGLTDAILQVSMLLDRISLEFDERKSMLAEPIWDEIHLVSVKVDAKGEKKDIKQVLIEAVGFRLSILKRHVTLMNNWLTQFVAIRNIGSMYWLSIVVLLATVIGLVGIGAIEKSAGNLWETIYSWLHMLLFRKP